ncbi:MAG TPA: universal stress protein [Anaerolineales bacterium]|nr:universal stress protein [Anaerolineales bacterium]HNA89483.1 universal stress protein [Anaerolineales bacterium]HNB36933.1 universal stress protein [Anaerolineales bacterium]
MKPEILIVTNGYEGTWSAIEEGAWFASALDAAITLLGVNEQANPAAIDDSYPLEGVFERAVGLFQAQGLEYRLEVRNGSAEDVLARYKKQDDSILVLGPLGRPQMRRWIVGRSIRHFIEEVEQPILYVPEIKLPIKKVLLCVGGLGYDVIAERLALKAATKSGAELTLLHIVPPVDLKYPTAQAVSKNWQHLADTDTPVGRSLRQSLEYAKAAGLNVSVKGRQGNVVEEILLEVQEGKYDLLCMGSSYSVHSLRQMTSANVTAEVIEVAGCPVLTARYKKE